MFLIPSLSPNGGSSNGVTPKGEVIHSGSVQIEVDPVDWLLLQQSNLLKR